MRLLPDHFSRAALLSLALLAATDVMAATVAPTVGAATVVAPAIFAKVGDVVITQDEYKTAFDAAARGKFYHGKPPEHEVALLQREVGDQMVARILLLREAKQRGLRPDAAEIQKTVQGYEQRYAGSEQWKKNRAQALPPLVARLEQEDLLSQLEKTVRGGVKVSEKQVKAYYAAHQEQFTEPEQMRVSVILLKVEPSATSATWKKAEEQAQALAKRVRAGEDFAALARQHSGDGSAPQGGDMGYLHSGMLPEGTQAALAKLKNGETSDAVRLLEGLAVFRLTDRKVARLRDFEAVKVRAQELAQRELGNDTWTAFIADLKTKTAIQMDQSRFLPLAK